VQPELLFTSSLESKKIGFKSFFVDEFLANEDGDLTMTLSLDQIPVSSEFWMVN